MNQTGRLSPQVSGVARQLLAEMGDWRVLPRSGGVAIDSLFAHWAWTRNIEEKFGVKNPCPTIEEIKMEVAHAYGMVHPSAADTEAVRATFFIIPTGVLRAMVYYPMSNGRSIAEFVRLQATLDARWF